mmetsp:Transcript_51756/g.149232  ORF Transcript_51756/g.149232 Transcript_51756/m.149232 type:complete len:270 (+) Transcript_51756:210-1019(+)
MRPSSEGLRARSETHHRRLRVGQRFQALLASELDHRRRAAHEHEHVVGGGRKAFLNHIGGDEALLPGPTGRWKVQGIRQLEAAVACLRELVQHVAAQDVLLRLVRINQREGALVLRVSECRLHHLQHGSQAGAARHHAHVLDCDSPAGQLEDPRAHVLVDTQRAHDVDVVPDLLSIQVQAHLAAILPIHLLAIWHLDLARAVHLDHHVDVARSLVRGRGRVLPLNLRLALVRVGLPVPRAARDALLRVRRIQQDVLPDWQAEDSVLRTQ